MSVPETLRGAGVPFALIGAVAMAAHGHSRSTADVDFLVADRRVLDTAMWPAGSVSVGDTSDPLTGVVRLRGVDVVVIARSWAAGIVERAGGLVADVAGARVPVATAPDLVMLKLYAGSPLDLRDAELLLLDGDVARAMAPLLAAGPRVCRRNWSKLAR